MPAEPVPDVAVPDDRPVLVVLRALGLGDLLVGVPALRALRRAHPGHRVVLAAPPELEPLVPADAVDDLLPARGPGALAWPWPAPDVAVNLHGAGPESHRTLDAVHPRVRIGFRAAGWPGPEWAEHPGCHERERWCGLLAAHAATDDAAATTDAADLLLPPPPGAPVAGPPPVLVHPGAQFGCKRWPGHRFAEVARALAAGGNRVLLTGSPDERPLALAVARDAGLAPGRVLAGRTSLAQLRALVAAAALVVCGDTGVAHVASAQRTPSVVLFGPVPASRWGPPEDGPHVALSDDAARRGDRFADDPDPALLGVSVGSVLAAAHDLLAGGRPERAAG